MSDKPLMRDARIKRMTERMDRLGKTLPPNVLAEFSLQLPHMTSRELDEWLKEHDTTVP